MIANTQYKPRNLVEHLQFTVKRVVASLEGGDEAIGTGYLFETAQKDDLVIRFLVMNAHLIEDAVSIKFLMHLCVSNGGEEPTPNGQTIFLKCELNDDTIVYHPDDDIDLVALLVGPVFSEWRSKAEPNYDLYFFCLSPDEVASDVDLDNLQPTSIVTMVGCPEGLWDDLHGFPLFRRGFLASTPSINYQGRPEFAIDILVFSGSSGSPIFTVSDTSDEHLYLKLLGTLWGSPRVTASGVDNEAVPILHPDTQDSAGRTHIGLAIKAKELLILAKAVETFVMAREASGQELEPFGN